MDAQLHWQLLAAGGLLGLILGAIVARTDFCTMGAVSDWVNMGSLGRLRAWLLAMAVAIGAVTVLEMTALIDLAVTFPPYRSTPLNLPRMVLGGLLFGAGMTLASGCVNKNLVRLGAGNLKALVVLAAAGLAAYAMTWTGLYAQIFSPWLNALTLDVATPAAETRRWLGGALAVGLMGFCLGSRDFRRSPELWVGGLSVGALVALGWWLTGGTWGREWQEWAQMADVPPLRVAAQSFTFVSALGDGVHLLSGPQGAGMLTFSIVSALGVVMGSTANALATQRWRLEWFPNVADARNHLIGGILIGVGGNLAMGCTIGQGVTGVSTLAAASFVAVAAMIAGSAATMRLQYRFL